MLTLTGINTFNGNTTVDGGALFMPGGSLTSPTDYVGYAASGSFTQTGGTNAAPAGTVLILGFSTAASSGTYSLSGGSPRVTIVWRTHSDVIRHGAASSNQAATVSIGGCSFYLGNESHADFHLNGSYSLSGSGLLSAYAESVGNSSSGSFTQTGGLNSVTGYLLEIGFNQGGSGSYIPSAEAACLRCAVRNYWLRLTSGNAIGYSACSPAARI